MKNLLFSILVAISVICTASCKKDEAVKSSEKQILEFTINSGEGTINHQTKQVNLTIIANDVKELAPVIKVSDKASVSPKSGEKKDFTLPVEYTVTAEDGSTVKYTVTVSATSETGTKITSFIFYADVNSQTQTLVGSINEKNKAITVETQYWIPKPDALIATFATNGTVTVNGTEQQSGVTANNFLSDVVYKVAANDGNYAEYTVSLVSPQTSGLPVINIDIDGGKEIVDKKSEYDSATLQLIDLDNTEYSFEKRTGIRGRGNSTWGLPKKPYRLKFNEKTSMFGLGKEKSWVLLANYLDPSVLMNDVAFELGRRFGLKYTNHSFHVELFMNGTYRGTYQVTEQVQVNKNRVNIDEDKGFLVELDTYMDEDWRFYTNIIQLPVMVKSPEVDNEAGIDFVKKAMQDLENALFDSNFPNNNYKDLVDINSLIDFMLVNEITRNQELNHPKSVYAYKDKNTKICWGPLWDFDWGFGYAEYGHNYFQKTDILFYKNGYNGSQKGSRFYNRFFDDPEFCNLYKKRWNELKSSQIETIVQYIETMTEKLEKAQYQNYKRWTNYSSLNFRNETGKMKNWLTNRIAFLDNMINKL